MRTKKLTVLVVNPNPNYPMKEVLVSVKYYPAYLAHFNYKTGEGHDGEPASVEPTDFLDPTTKEVLPFEQFEKYIEDEEGDFFLSILEHTEKMVEEERYENDD